MGGNGVNALVAVKASRSVRATGQLYEPAQPIPLQATVGAVIITMCTGPGRAP